jgi:predicted DNA-binding transcriptional regulator AlpA
MRESSHENKAVELEPLLTARQVAQAASVSLITIRRLSPSQLPRIKIGTKAVRYRASDVQNLLQPK